LAVILHRHRDRPEEALEHYRAFLSGSAMNLPADHPAFADLRECEQLVALRLEERALAQRAAEEAAAAGEAPAVEAAEETAAAEAAAAPTTAEPRPAGGEAAAPVDPEEPEDEF